MNDLKIGDRVRIISDPKFIKFNGAKSIIGMTGTVKSLSEISAGVEFDEDISEHCGAWHRENGYFWHILYERLEKIEDTEEEIKAETMEQKILTALREEIGVKVGEEFDVYENGVKRWTCKFEENGHLDRYKKCKFSESFIWKYWIFHFNKYEFKRKPFMPQNGEKYWHFGIRDSLNGNKSLDVLENVWDSLLFDYGMLALGNVFRSKEEALKGEDKLLERLNELLKEE